MNIFVQTSVISFCEPHRLRDDDQAWLKHVRGGFSGTTASAAMCRDVYNWVGCYLGHMYVYFTPLVLIDW